MIKFQFLALLSIIVLVQFVSAWNDLNEQDQTLIIDDDDQPTRVSWRLSAPLQVDGGEAVRELVKRHLMDSDETLEIEKVESDNDDEDDDENDDDDDEDDGKKDEDDRDKVAENREDKKQQSKVLAVAPPVGSQSSNNRSEGFMNRLFGVEQGRILKGFGMGGGSMG